MTEQLLTDELAATLSTLDKLAAQHRQAEAYDLKREQLTFVHSLLRELLTELRVLRLVVMIQQHVGSSGDESQLRQQTLRTLQARASAAFKAVGRAIADGGIDLLQLVDFASAARAIVQERRISAAMSLAHHLSQQGTEQVDHAEPSIISLLQDSSAVVSLKGSADELLDLLDEFYANLRT